MKKLVSPAIDSLGLYERRLRAAARVADRWTIVMYHRVVTDETADPFHLGMCVERRNFESQLRFMRDCFHIIPVAEGARRLQAGESLPAGALSITFDDGYLDNLTNAAPILESLGIPWTLFIVNGGLDHDEMLWWDRTIAAFAGTSRPAVDSDAIGLPGPAMRLPLDSIRAETSAEIMLAHLWTLPHGQRMALVQRIEQVLAPRLRPELVARRLSSAQIVELHRRGVEIGAHSIHHPNLGLCDDETATAEMLTSKQGLEALLQAPVRGFAYPGGRLSPATPGLARQCGFDYALATEVGVNDSRSDPFRLMRIGMPDAPLADFRRALSGAMRRGMPEPGLTF
ncbi:MAG: polysaccharide deacetylase family protein [Gammaproteobacteria bacterium]